MTPIKGIAPLMDTTTETTGLVCMMHDRYWPCKKLKGPQKQPLSPTK